MAIVIYPKKFKIKIVRTGLKDKRVLNDANASQRDASKCDSSQCDALERDVRVFYHKPGEVKDKFERKKTKLP